MNARDLSMQLGLVDTEAEVYVEVDGERRRVLGLRRIHVNGRTTAVVLTDKVTVFPEIDRSGKVKGYG